MTGSEIAPEIGWLSVWLLGLSVGLTTCTVACLPYLGTWVIGQGLGTRAALGDTAAFASGKVLAYGVLGGLAAGLGQVLLKYLQGGVGHTLIGLVAVASGVYLLWRKPAARRCGLSQGDRRLSPFSMGFALSFTPCAPLAALLAAAATAGEVPSGVLYGLLFGIGAAMTPLFIVIPLLGGFARRIQAEQPWLGPWLLRFAAMVLIAIGLRRLWLVI